MTGFGLPFWGAVRVAASSRNAKRVCGVAVRTSDGSSSVMGLVQFGMGARSAADAGQLLEAARPTAGSRVKWDTGAKISI